MYTIEIEATKQLVRVKHSEEFRFTIPDIQRYNRDLAARLDVALARFGKIKLLIDSSGSPIASPEAAAVFATPDQMLRNSEGRLGLVSNSYLKKLQGRRVLGDDDRIRFFLSAHAAEAWLLDNQLSASEAAAAMQRTSAPPKRPSEGTRPA